jgi:hypothetical protein
MVRSISRVRKIYRDSLVRRESSLDNTLEARGGAGARF